MTGRLRQAVILAAAMGAAVGCARFDYELGGQASSGSSSGAAAGAAGMAGELPPFSAPARVAALSDPSADDDDPTLTGDRLEIYFSSERSGGLGKGDIWRSARTRLDAAWAPPEHVPELSSPDDETSAAIAPDGLTIWISSDRQGTSGGFDVWLSQRPDRQSGWPEPARVASLSTDGDEIVRSTSPDGVLLAWRPAGALDYDLFEAAGSPAAGYASALPLASLNTERNEVDPFLAFDARTLYFTATGVAGADDDLYVAEFASSGEGWVVRRPLAELNGTADDTDPWVCPDQSYIVFASDRLGDQLDLFEAWR